MLRKFNETSIYNKFIKALIASTYVPSIEVWKPNKPIIKDFQYITKNYIVEAKESWAPQNGDDKGYTLDSEIDSNYFKILRPFIEGEYYRNVTTNYISNRIDYDSKTHFYLGQYLRQLRDFHDINLMPFYNCINEVGPEKIRIKESLVTQNEKDYSYSKWNSNVINNNTDTDNYKILMAPIYFNQDYTIYIDCDLPIAITAICYDGENKINNYISDSGVIHLNKVTKNNPIVYNVTQNIGSGYSSMYYRNYLTLVIQVPKTCNNVVVLEGNYKDIKPDLTNNKNELGKVIFGDDYNKLSLDDVNRYCKVLPALTRSLTNELYAYDDILIEYLLRNVIYKDDEISDNITRIQKYCSSYEFEKYNGIRFDSPYTKGIWDNKLRMFLYDLMTKSNDNNKKKTFNTQLINVTGYIDKEMETLVTRGQDV